MWERTGKGCNSINMKSGVCLDEETYAAYLRQKWMKNNFIKFVRFFRKMSRIQ